MTPEWIHPGLVLILGAWVLPFLRGQVKRVAMVALPAVALVLCLTMTQYPGFHLQETGFFACWVAKMSVIC